jgi:hypothetical protein
MAPDDTLSGLTGRLFGAGHAASARSTPHMARDAELQSPAGLRRPQAAASER